MTKQLDIFDLLPDLSEFCVKGYTPSSHLSQATFHVFNDSVSLSVHKNFCVHRHDYPKPLFPRYVEVAKIIVNSLEDSTPLFKNLANRFSRHIQLTIGSNHLYLVLPKLINIFATIQPYNSPIGDKPVDIIIADIYHLDGDKIWFDSWIIQMTYGHNYNFDISISVPHDIPKDEKIWLKQSLEEYVKSSIADWMIKEC